MAPFQQDTLKDLMLFQEDHLSGFVQNRFSLCIPDHGMVKVYARGDFTAHGIGAIPDKGVITSWTMFIHGQAGYFFSQQIENKQI